MTTLLASVGTFFGQFALTIIFVAFTYAYLWTRIAPPVVKDEAGKLVKSKLLDLLRRWLK